MGIEKNVQETTATFVAILVLGLMGLIFLIVFGNLSGNLGFTDSSTTVTNESSVWVNTTPYIIDGQATAGFTGFSVTGIWNFSDGTAIPTANYTVDSSAGTIVNATTLVYSNVNLSYTYTFDSESERNTESVIGNLTGGARDFFSFSNVWFILLAVVLLIIIAISVIEVVSSKKSRGEGDSTPSFSS